MDDFVLLGLLAVVAFLLGPIGFFLTLGARSRLTTVESSLRVVEAKLAALTGAPRAEEAPAVAPGPAAPQTAAEAPPQASPAGLIGRLEETPAAPPLANLPPIVAPPLSAPEAPPFTDWGAASSPRPAAPTPARGRTVGLEEQLGARWAVIVGGVALALGALLLVKYSIEQGFFGPGLRVLGGLLLGVALVAGGEYLRRREGPAEASAQAAPIPAVLTGAGTVAAFGSLFAAHALYGFIGPGLAFIAMGAVGLAAMFAAALHGPALAGLGLVGALATPLLVSSGEPRPWPVVIYIAVVCASAYGLARLRRWLWLAISAAVGAALWQCAFLTALDGVNGADVMLASFVNLVVETALAIVAFAFAPHFSTPESEQRTDAIGSLAMVGCAALACLTLGATSLNSGSGAGWILAASLVTAMLAVTGARLPAVAAASVAAGLIILAALKTWGSHGAPVIISEHLLDQWPTPDGKRMFVGFGLIASLALGVLSFRRLLALAPLSLNKAALYAGAGVLTPLAAVSILYLRLAHFEASGGLAATAAGVGALMAVGAALFRQRETAGATQAVTLGLGALAAGAIAALSLGLVFALSEGTLTVALALAAFGSALVSERLRIPALRWCVAGLGLAVAGRFLYDPRIVGDALGKTIVFNWLLFGYGVPAFAFGLAARLMRRSAEDAPMRVAQALAILCAALLAFFEIRHAMNGGDPFAPASGMVEQGLFAIIGILFSLTLMELNARRADWLYAYASLAFGALTLAQTAIGLLLAENPYYSGAPIEGGGLFNGLILGYLTPAVAGYALARRSRGRTPEWRYWAAAAVTLALLFAYVNLELRRLFQGGPEIGHLDATSESEFYAYSALWLGLGILLLTYGVLTQSKAARLASAALVSLTVLKVFLLDLAGLEGVLRALSFLGLGVALIGIGLVYQKLVFARRPDGEAKAAPAAEI